MHYQSPHLKFQSSLSHPSMESQVSTTLGEPGLIRQRFCTGLSPRGASGQSLPLALSSHFYYDLVLAGTRVPRTLGLDCFSTGSGWMAFVSGFNPKQQSSHLELCRQRQSDIRRELKSIISGCITTPGQTPTPWKQPVANDASH